MAEKHNHKFCTAVKRALAKFVNVPNPADRSPRLCGPGKSRLRVLVSGRYRVAQYTADSEPTVKSGIVSEAATE
jgi:hypothetical protein